MHDVKNGFRAALTLAGIDGFTWHDLRHTFASWLMMRGASLRSVAELLGHQSMKMTMRYAHLSSAFLSAGVSLLDPPAPSPKNGKKSKRARKGQSAVDGDRAEAKVPDFVKSGPRDVIATHRIRNCLRTEQFLGRDWLTSLDNFRNWLIREAA